MSVAKKLPTANDKAALMGVGVYCKICNFDDFWKRINKQWGLLTIKERNFRKSIGLHPDKAVAMQAWSALSAMPPVQFNLSLNNQHRSDPSAF
jgi:hypothetical protein